MIGIDRSSVARPEVLDQPYSSGPNLGKTERQVVIEALLAHRGKGEPDEKFTFDFKRYKEDDVKAALDELFHGKCAYCETFYSASQPMDVEHWRPKGEVHVDGAPKPLKPGYYWLAATWENLLPSCIDCNRAREQHDIALDKAVRLGKANQFPLPPGKQHARSHDPEPDLVAESALLINPCDEDPEAFFEYTVDGVILPRSGLAPEARARAEASIQVYALNRAGLVVERREVVRRIQHRKELMERLGELHVELEPDRPQLAVLVEELIAVEADALLAMKRPAAPFAGVARFFAQP